MKLNFKGKTAVITGASGGMGLEMSKKLSQNNISVLMLDLKSPSKEFLDNNRFKLIEGDIRDKNKFESAVQGCDVVIHLACISNDPSFALNEGLSKTINFDCFEDLVKISKKSKVKRFAIHRIVASAFLSNDENKREVNHINGIKTDNRVENIEWVTPSENMKHAYKFGLKIANRKTINNKFVLNVFKKNIK